ncbi:hypothetical protein [Anaerocolumna xylanovorans]|uniref:Uncharacterized protein n=1 Tax=Anaerocolumna xylanovorans DSM 12503 TaxID=1121345 RepID=A0A1M7YDU0_9FIRM|nr:hypothetical protein [Anaerocolumna xylanovorans]SHO50751.1 hypothetical protein SAMN02745217_02876 [Anaerocolumna xylanovorans DSM 12503]
MFKEILVYFSFSRNLKLFLFFSLGSIVVTAQYISGGEFFKDFFNQRANGDINNNYDYMNTEQLKNLESSTIGTVINSPEITVDVLGVIKSGNTVDVMLEITANQLDSVLYDNGIESLKNYRFNDNLSGTLCEDTDQISSRYYYSDEDKSLETNQFKILYTFVVIKNPDETDLSLGLSEFGYFPKNETSHAAFNILYNDKWEYRNFSKNVSNFKFNLDNEQTIDSDQFEYTSAGNPEEAEFEVIITFKVPVAIDTIKSISLFDKDFDLK